MMETLKDVIERAAGTKYHAAPFWAWNDALDKQRLLEQLEGMREKHIGGVFIHSRDGLETEYLSKEWMDCTDAVIDHAGRTGMEVWIYDEDTWPSGSAGGAVSAADPAAFSAKGLTIEILPIDSPASYRSTVRSLHAEASILAIYRIERDPESSHLFSFEQLPSEDAGPADLPGELLAFRVETSGPSEWYNGSAPSDNLNPEAVRRFLDLTHEQYAKRFSDSFGTVVKGFFTDEPNVCDFFSSFTEGRPWLPWGGDLLRFFEQKRGYSMLLGLPLLFFEGSGMEKMRYDYWLSVTELFVSSYTRQLHDWCDERDLSLTGHMLYENDLGYGVRCSGAVMPHYRWMHAPGIDLLGDQREEYLTVKQCTSVANQFRREMVVSEMYGCTGWEFSFAGQKRLGDWQYIMGVTRRCQHLALYSITGCRKRDYPPAFNYQAPWWEHSHLLEDYFARLGACTRAGTVHREILMVHPVGTFWMKSGSSPDEDLSKVYMNMGWLDRHFTDLNREGDWYNRLTEELLRLQFDFDFGDELIMKESGSIEEGRLKVGFHSYSCIVVPPVETLMDSTVLLLQEFLDAGGHIAWMAPFPKMIDALETDELDCLIAHERVHQVESVSELASCLDTLIKRPVRILDRHGNDVKRILSMTREVESGRIITVTHTGDTEIDDVLLLISCRGRVTQLDLLTGDTSPVAVRSLNSDRMETKITFSAEETKVFFIAYDEEPEEVRALTPAYHHPHDSVSLVYGFPAVCQVELSGENGLTLDRCRIRVGDGPWEEEQPVWIAQKLLREQFGMQPVYYNGGPQRYLWIDDDTSYPVVLQFTFTSDEIPDGEVFAVVEKSQDMRITCNGDPCSLTDDWFIDRDFQKWKMPSLVAGENTLELSLDYTAATEFENIYIIGAFGVSPDRQITSLPTHLRRGDWTTQGLFHYPGSCTYRYTVPAVGKQDASRQLMLKLGEFSGTLAVIRIDGGEPIYALRERAIPVSGLLDPEREHRVEIEIIGSLRNLLGPLHRSANVCSRISWEDFHPHGSLYTPEYGTEPAGLLGEVYLYTLKQEKNT